jgi:hypothetical protein
LNAEFKPQKLESSQLAFAIHQMGGSETSIFHEFSLDLNGLEPHIYIFIYFHIFSPFVNGNSCICQAEKAEDTPLEDFVKMTEVIHGARRIGDDMDETGTTTRHCFFF